MLEQKGALLSGVVDGPRPLCYDRDPGRRTRTASHKRTQRRPGHATDTRRSYRRARRRPRARGRRRRPRRSGRRGQAGCVHAHLRHQRRRGRSDQGGHGDRGRAGPGAGPEAGRQAYAGPRHVVRRRGQGRRGPQRGHARADRGQDHRGGGRALERRIPAGDGRVPKGLGARHHLLLGLSQDRRAHRRQQDGLRVPAEPHRQRHRAVLGRRGARNAQAQEGGSPQREHRRRPDLSPTPREWFQQNAKEVEVVADEFVDRGVTDLTPQLAKIKRVGAQVIIGEIYGSSGPVLFNQWYELKVPALIAHMGATVAAQSFIDQHAKVMDGAIINNRWWPARYSEVSEPMMAAYRKKANTDATNFVVQAHDATLIALEAISRAGSLDPEKIRGAIESGTFATAWGTRKFTPLAEGHRMPIQTVVIQVQNGKKVPIFPASVVATTGGKFVPVPPYAWEKK